MFATLSCAATMVIRIPTPIGGYIHAGDAVVLLSVLAVLLEQAVCRVPGPMRRSGKNCT